MRVAWNVGGRHRSLETVREGGRRAAREGFARFRLFRITGADALAADVAEVERTSALIRALCREGARA